MKEITNHSPDEILTQILANQRILLLTAIRFVTPHCAERNNAKWTKLNNSLVDEYHRTMELIGEEKVGEYWKAESGSRL